MPRIFDNIDQALLPALRQTLQLADRADFCVGYFNLRGWKQIDASIDRWSGGAGHCCRLLVGMQRLPQDDLRQAFSLALTSNGIDNQAALRLKKKLAQDFREQLSIGAPTNQDEAGLKRLAAQIRAKKVVVKLFLRHPLHAKLYLLFRPDPISPTVGYLGSSNLTFAGLSQQGELNLDVVDEDACQKLAHWFEERWEDRWCIDISQELIDIIEESWARTALLTVLRQCGAWDPQRDAKLSQLVWLITRRHRGEKVLVFSQFADTVHYLAEQLQAHGINRVGAATGDTDDPTQLAWYFSPVSNNKRSQVSPDSELDILIATDVLSEGQNLQDAAIGVNYDIPWAIIRLIQRAGRVDRIGQQAETIVCYSFLPADGVERIIRLRARVRQRLREDAEVVGSDEAFFDDDQDDQVVRDLFTEKAGILDGDADTEVDLSSYAFQIWKNAIDRDPSLQKTIAELPNVVYATKLHRQAESEPPGVLVYVRTAEGNDALAWVDQDGNSITESQFTILKAAACMPETPALPRRDDHHDLVRRGIELIAAEEKSVGGQLGRPSGARFRTYERLKRYADMVKDTLFDSQQLRRAIEDIYSYPLRQAAIDVLNRQLRSGISDEALVQLVTELRETDRLSIIHEEETSQEPHIICSLGLASQGGEGSKVWR